MPERKITYMPLDEIVGADRNPKQHNIDGIKAALSSFGVADAIGIVDGRTGRLVGGHGRTEALRDLFTEGSPPPDGIIVKKDMWLVPVFTGWSSKDDREAEAVIIALNQQTMVAGFDHQLYDAMLRDLHAAGYDALAVMAADEWPSAFSAVPDFAPDPNPQPRLDHVTPNRCPSCGYAWHVLADGTVVAVETTVPADAP